MNKSLPQIDQIAVALLENSISVTREFGYKFPRIFTVTIGKGSDVSLFARIVNLVKEYGLDGISYADEDISAGQIYIGSYGYDVQPHLPVDSETFKKFDFENISKEDLKATITTSPSLRPLLGRED